MTRSLCLLLAIAMFLMGIDAATDAVRAGHAHAVPSVHQDGQADRSAGLLQDGQRGDDYSGFEHCQLCCLGHLSMMTMNPVLRPDACGGMNLFAQLSLPGASRSIAPPTPPPNA